MTFVLLESIDIRSKVELVKLLGSQRGAWDVEYRTPVPVRFPVSKP